MTDGVSRHAAEIRRRAEEARTAEQAESLRQQAKREREAEEEAAKRQLLDQFFTWAVVNKVPTFRRRLGFSIFKGWQVAQTEPNVRDSWTRSRYMLWVSSRGEATMVGAVINPITREPEKHGVTEISLRMFSLEAIEEGIAAIVAKIDRPWP